MHAGSVQKGDDSGSTGVLFDPGRFPTSLIMFSVGIGLFCNSVLQLWLEEFCAKLICHVPLVPVRVRETLGLVSHCCNSLETCSSSANRKLRPEDLGRLGGLTVADHAQQPSLDGLAHMPRGC